MSLEFLAYPFLTIAIYFETFVLVTFLSAPARHARARSVGVGPLPLVAIIIPCFNEAKTLRATVESVLALDYPIDKLSLILVNDGSTDGTSVAMRTFTHHPQVTVLIQKNGGKHSALNTGIAATNAELIGCLDADSTVAPYALREIVACFDMPAVAAATAGMSVHEARNPLQWMQHVEYLLGILWRHVFASINGLYVTPGPFSFYRRSVVITLGGFRYGHQAEDMEMALRLQRAGHSIANAPKAHVYTKAPHTLMRLLKQRRRWTSGFLRNVLFDYRDLIGSNRNHALGFFVLPLALLSVMSGSLLFIAAIFSTIYRVSDAITIRAGVPVSYAYLPHYSHLDWFYAPTTPFTFLGLIALGVALSFILLGSRVSNIQGPIKQGMLAYVFLYGITAPLWLLSAAFDVALGKKRSWR